MRHLNYSHLLYFWTIAREGGVTRAAEVLHLTPQTVSGQIKLLEEAVGEPLFQRTGRKLVLTEMGRAVMHYADGIFSVGAELAEFVRGKRRFLPTTLQIGITDSVPKLIAGRIVGPALGGEAPLRVQCREGSLQALLGELAVHRLDLVIADTPLPHGLNVRAWAHVLGDSAVSVFTTRAAAVPEARAFPGVLDGEPLVLPSPGTTLRLQIDEWFESKGVRPRVVAEADDSALQKALGQLGAGAFVAPTVIEAEVARMYGARVLGRLPEVRQRYYAISAERRLKHPAVARLIEAARPAIAGG